MSEFSTEQNPDAYGSGQRYPSLPPIPSFLGFSLGFSEEGRRAFTDFHLISAQQYGFVPNPVEKEALTYYNGTFYGAEALGARNGVLGGGAIGLLVALRSKRPWRIFRSIGNRIGMSPRYQHAFSRGVTLWMFSQIGKFYGATSAGVAAFGQISAQQKNDPNMQRYLAMRKKWVESHGPLGISEYGELKKRYEQAKDMGALPSQSGGGQSSQDDEQSLGGLDFYDTPETQQRDTRGTVPATAGVHRQPRPYERPITNTRPSEEEDPFQFSSPSDDDASPRSKPGESVWERIRRGERPAVSVSTREGKEEEPERQEFLSPEQERQYAKEQAQKEFEEALERERKAAGGLDGFVGDEDQDRKPGRYRR